MFLLLYSDQESAPASNKSIVSLLSSPAFPTEAVGRRYCFLPVHTSLAKRD